MFGRFGHVCLRVPNDHRAVPVESRLKLLLLQWESRTNTIDLQTMYTSYGLEATVTCCLLLLVLLAVGRREPDIFNLPHAQSPRHKTASRCTPERALFCDVILKVGAAVAQHCAGFRFQNLGAPNSKILQSEA